MINSFDSAALRLADAEIEKLLDANTLAMSTGANLDLTNASTTAQNYASHCGYCRALRDVQNLLKTVEEDLKRS